MGISCKLAPLDRQGLHWIEENSDAAPEFLMLLTDKRFSQEELSKVPEPIRAGLVAMDAARAEARESLERRAAPPSVLDVRQENLFSLDKGWRIIFRAIEMISESYGPFVGLVDEARNDSIRLWSESEVVEARKAIDRTAETDWDGYLQEAAIREKWEFAREEDMATVIETILGLERFLEDAARHNKGVAVCFL